MLMPGDYKNLGKDELNGVLLAEFEEHQAQLREWWQLRDELTDDQEKWRNRDRRLGRIILIAMCLSIVAWVLEATHVSCALAAIVMVSTVMRLTLALAIRRRVERRMRELAARIATRSGQPPAQSVFTPITAA